MNKKEIYLNRMKTLSYFDSNSIIGKQGYVKIWGTDKKHCRIGHEKTKFEICFKLRTEYGYEIWTEVEFKNGKGRADILCIDKQGNGYIIEVLDSETNKKFEIKLEYYPLPIYKVFTKDFDINKWVF